MEYNSTNLFVGTFLYNDWAIMLILDDALVLGNKDQVNICA